MLFLYLFIPSFPRWRPLRTRRSYRTLLPQLFPHNRLLNCHLFTKLLQRILPLQFLQLPRCILIQELINTQISTPHPNIDLILIHPHSHPLAPKLIHPLTLPHKHNLQFLPLRIIIYKLSQFLINLIILHRYIHSNPLLQLYYIILQCLNLHLRILQLLQ